MEEKKKGKKEGKKEGREKGKKEGRKEGRQGEKEGEGKKMTHEQQEYMNQEGCMLKMLDSLLLYSILL